MAAFGKTSLLLSALFIALVSCAGFAARSAARSEFDAGLSVFNRGRYEEAVPHFVKATELEPEFGRAYLYLGRSYLNLSRWSDAVPPLRTAFRLAPEESRREMADIILDVLLQNASGITPDHRSGMEDLLLNRGEEGR